MTTINKGDDIVDSRDVIEALEQLQGERDGLEDDSALAEWDEDHGEELKELAALCEEGESYAEDWKDGASLIHERYWVEYCKEMLADIGDLPKDLPHYIAIDWEKTADNLRADYSEIEWGGETYLVRSC